MTVSIQSAERKKAALEYKILYHKNGYIRLEIPSLRKLAWSIFFTSFRKTLPFNLPPAIKNFHVNPLKGSVVIIYEPEKIDILDYIRKMAADPRVKTMIKG